MVAPKGGLPFPLWWLAVALGGRVLVILLVLAVRRSGRRESADGALPSFRPDEATFEHECSKCRQVIRLPQSVMGREFRCAGCGAVQVGGQWPDARLETGPTPDARLETGPTPAPLFLQTSIRGGCSGRCPRRPPTVPRARRRSVTGGERGTRTASYAASPAAPAWPRRVDLLTVVMHESGHELGLADADARLDFDRAFVG